MMTKGSQSIAFQEAPYIISSGSVVGKKEGEGPLGKLFDMVEMENLFGEDTWEAAESTMQKEACLLAVGKADIALEKVRYLFGGDLLRQGIATSMGGFPCQAFSICGLMKGFEDKTRGTLFFDIARIIKEKQPQAFVLENVKNLASHDGGKTLQTILETLRDELGYHVDYHLLNALDFGLPQKRERIIIVGSKKPFKMDWNFEIKNKKTLNDILEKKVDSKHYASPEIVAKRKAMHTAKVFPSIWHENKSGNISSYPYSCALRAGASYNYLLVNGERRLTPREMLRLQGFPDDFKIVVSDCQTRKQAGNAIPVDMVKMVIERFIPMAF